jgi:hypothetical protein
MEVRVKDFVGVVLQGVTTVNGGMQDDIWPDRGQDSFQFRRRGQIDFMHIDVVHNVGNSPRIGGRPQQQVDFVILPDKVVSKVGTDEAGGTCDYYFPCLHDHPQACY